MLVVRVRPAEQERRVGREPALDHSVAAGHHDDQIVPSQAATLIYAQLVKIGMLKVPPGAVSGLTSEFQQTPKIISQPPREPDRHCFRSLERSERK
jgi:hypothetical protein